jgi:hypothetical protein
MGRHELLSEHDVRSLPTAPQAPCLLARIISRRKLGMCFLSIGGTGK